MTKRIVVAGSSGLIGSALVESLQARGDDVVRLVRTRGASGGSLWDPASGQLESSVLAGANAVVSLNGTGIGDKRWSPQRKELLRSTRTAPVGLLARTIATMDGPPSVLVTGSATGFYGDTGNAVVDETAGVGDDFLARLCADWEHAAAPALDAGIRVASARTGIVLAASGGALSPLLPLFNFGLGGPIGKGEQWWSWISLEDEVNALLHIIDDDVSGPVNLVAPQPVRQKDFAKALGRQLGRPAVLPAPKFAVKARLGKELAEAIGFTSQRVQPCVLERTGFSFKHQDVATALAAVLD
ncbi:MAG: TIGR01777 family oxidoreductase [Actinomycetia bacterium]|nr:TIGR01777 family oxidoreductase [Actinomycetes bacterium]